MRYFLGILLVILAGFATAFTWLVPSSEEGYASLPDVFYTLYNVMIGGGADDVYFAGSRSPEVSIALYFSFMLIVAIVLLNLLIAIMGDSFDRVQENAEDVFQRERAGQLVEMELNMTNEELKNEEYFPKYVDVLMAADGSGSDSGAGEEWSGRINILRKHMDARQKESQKEMKEQVEDLEKKMKEQGEGLEKVMKKDMKEQLLMQVEGLESRLDARIDMILSLLQKE